MWTISVIVIGCDDYTSYWIHGVIVDAALAAIGCSKFGRVFAALETQYSVHVGLRIENATAVVIQAWYPKWRRRPSTVNVLGLFCVDCNRSTTDTFFHIRL